VSSDQGKTVTAAHGQLPIPDHPLRIFDDSELDITPLDRRARAICPTDH
jgi:hypothetical protein